MSAFVDTSVLVDVLRGWQPALKTMEERRPAGPLHSSVVVKIEVLAGMRSTDEQQTRRLLKAVEWHPINEEVIEQAGLFGRQWLPSHSGIDVADLIVAATAKVLHLDLLTCNVHHFPMFSGLQAPY